VCGHNHSVKLTLILNGTPKHLYLYKSHGKKKGKKL
jgi:hypothetical protein